MQWNPMVPEILVQNFEASMSFYTQGIGFSVMFTRVSPRFAYLDLNRAQLMIEEDHELAWVVAPLTSPRGRGLNLQIEVADIHAAQKRLSAQGHRPFRNLRESWYDTVDGQEGQYEYLVQDPDGYLIRLVQVI